MCPLRAHAVVQMQFTAIAMEIWCYFGDARVRTTNVFSQLESCCSRYRDARKYYITTPIFCINWMSDGLAKYVRLIYGWHWMGFSAVREPAPFLRRVLYFLFADCGATLLLPREWCWTRGACATEKAFTFLSIRRASAEWIGVQCEDTAKSIFQTRIEHSETDERPNNTHHLATLTQCHWE